MNVILKSKKLLLFLNKLLKYNTVVLVDGTFHYNEEPVQFTEELFIEDIRITLIEISKQDFQSRNGVNVLINSANGKYYLVTFEMKFTDEEGLKPYDFEFVRRGGPPDSYIIQLDLKNEAIGMSGDMELRLMFRGRESYSLFTTKVGEIYDMYFYTYDVQLNGEDVELIAFPEKLSFDED